MADFMEFIDDPTYDFNAADEQGRTPLMRAALDIPDRIGFQELLERPNVNVNAQDANGETVLMYLIRDMAAILVDDLMQRNDINVNVMNKQGQTAFILFAIYNRLPMDEWDLFLQHPNLDVTVVDQYGKNAADYLIQRDALDYFKRVLNCEPNQKHNENRDYFDLDLHDCTDVDLSKDTTDCLGKLSKFRAFKVLGSGQSGIALLVSGSLVVKIMQKNTMASQLEVRQSCLVDDLLAKHSNLFSRTYGWLTCDAVHIPDQWRNITNYSMGECIFLVSEYGKGIPMHRYRFDSLYDCKAFFYEIVSALKFAFEKSKFVHNDLHAANVLYLPGPFPPRKYGNTSIRSLGRPMIIDFGYATFGETSTSEYHDFGIFQSYFDHAQRPDVSVSKWLEMMIAFINDDWNVTHDQVLQRIDIQST